MEAEMRELSRQLGECKHEEDWKTEHTRKVQGKLRYNRELQVCIDGDELSSSRPTQTYMTGADIDYGFKNVSQMQDKLCQQINQNIIAEDTLFQRLSLAEAELSRAMQILAGVERRETNL